MRRPRSWPLAGALVGALGIVLAVGLLAAGTAIRSLVQGAVVQQSLHHAQVAAAAARSDLVRDQRAGSGHTLSSDVADLATGGTFVLITTRTGSFQLSKGIVPAAMPAGGWLSGPAQGWFAFKGTAYAYARTALPLGRQLNVLVVVQPHPGAAALLSTLTEVLWVVGGALLLSLILGLLLVVQDVTEPLRALRTAAERVSESPADAGRRMPEPSTVREVQALTIALNRMLERLEAAQARERRFASDAAHALRTPVQVIRGYASTLSRWGHEDPTVRAEALAALNRSTAGLERLIQRLLELARLEGDSAVATFQPLDIAAWLRGTMPRLEDLAAHHPLALAGSAAAMGWSDPELLGALLAIWVENADAYADPDTTITIEVEPTPEGCRVAVVNAGPPIPEASLAHLAERFYRRHAESHDHFGLGLALADRLVHALHARWTVRCSEHRVIFAVHLPAARLSKGNPAK